MVKLAEGPPLHGRNSQGSEHNLSDSHHTFPQNRKDPIPKNKAKPPRTPVLIRGQHNTSGAIKPQFIGNKQR